MMLQCRLGASYRLFFMKSTQPANNSLKRIAGAGSSLPSVSIGRAPWRNTQTRTIVVTHHNVYDPTSQINRIKLFFKLPSQTEEVIEELKRNTRARLVKS